MKRIRNYFESQINELVEELRFYDVREMDSEASDVEDKIELLRNELDVLSDIEKSGEGNLLRFNEDGSFRLWCIRTPDDVTIIEHYDTDIVVEDVDYLLECSDCLDVTDTFSLLDVLPLVCITDDLSECMQTFDKYFLVDNDTFEEFTLIGEVSISLDSKVADAVERSAETDVGVVGKEDFVKE